MSNIKKIIIVLAILVLITIVIIISLNVYYNNKFISEDGKGLSEEEDIIIQNKYFNNLQIVSNRNTYYSIENIVNKYINSIKNYYTDVTYNRIDGEVKVTDEEKKQYFEEIKLLYKLDNITDNELTNIINVFDNYQYLLIDKIYVYKIDENKVIYPVDVYIVNENKSLSHVLIFIQVDVKNNTFNILQREYSDDIQSIVSQISFENIEQNSNNKMTYLSINEEDWIIKCFNDYKQKITASPEYFYNRLDEEYRNKRFVSKEAFIEYVKENYSTIYSAKINKYKITKNKDYTEYIFIDQYGNYYIMQETNPLQYIMFLDSYTIDRQEFIEKYDNGTDKTKLELNIGKFVEALNNKDYDYIYNHLDEEFKNNNFKTKDILENYIKSNFYDKNNISIDKYEKQNDIYIYDLTLKNAKNELQTKSLKVVLKLEENRNFVMSFSM